MSHKWKNSSSWNRGQRIEKAFAPLLRRRDPKYRQANREEQFRHIDYFTSFGTIDVKAKKISKTFHGSGCALSTSILCNFIKTKDLKESCLNANEYMRKILKNSIKTKNQDFINFS